MPWSLSLAEPVRLKDGRALTSLRDASAILLGLNERCQGSPWCQHAARLLIAAAESGDAGDITEATRQVRRALVREGMM